MDSTAQWPQGIGIHQVEQVENSSKSSSGVEKKLLARPSPKEQAAVNCPRCNSVNTKFCYYNNYSLSQPRYLCKTCRRYWTAGGSLRNVPVGGGSRKNKRPNPNSSINSSISSINNNNNNSASKKIITSIVPPNYSTPQNPKIHQGQDLNLAYNPFHYNGNISEFSAANLPFDIPNDQMSTKNNLNNSQLNPNDPSSKYSSQFSMMELLKSAGNMNTTSSRGLMSSFMSVPVSDQSNSMFSSGFPVHDHQFKPSLSFSLDGLDQNGYGNNLQGLQNNHTSSTPVPSRTNVVPFEELMKPVSANHDHDQFDDQQQDKGEANGYWNGMLAGGSW